MKQVFYSHLSNDFTYLKSRSLLQTPKILIAFFSLPQTAQHFINGLKRGRMVTRAQSLIVRMFEAICNCTSSNPLPSRVASTKSMPATQ